MSEVKKWHMPRGTSVSEGEDGEFVLASDYDTLAAECERLRSMLNRVVAEGILIADERDTLRQQRGKLSAVSNGKAKVRMPCRLHDVEEETDFPPNFARGYNQALADVRRLNAEPQQRLAAHNNI